MRSFNVGNQEEMNLIKFYPEGGKMSNHDFEARSAHPITQSQRHLYLQTCK